MSIEYNFQDVQTECGLFRRCAFFRVFASQAPDVCGKLMRQYCLGEGKEKCARRAWMISQGEPPPDNLQPDGILLQFEAKRSAESSLAV